MRVAEITYDQAAKLDPALLPPDAAVALRVNGVRAVIGLTPTGFGDVLVGELRTDDDRPVRLGGVRTGEASMPGLLVAPASVRGMGLLIAGLQRLVDTRPVWTVRQAG